MKPQSILLPVIALFATALPSGAAVSQQTLDNLNTAFQGESNAAHRYEVFAKIADAEGHAYVARLFRAASRAESIHRESHKAAILALGGTAKEFQLDEVKPQGTAENLKAAIAGETHERDSMYPDFLKQARQDNAMEAIRTFTYAQKAEAGHAELYQNALGNLGKLKDVPLYVCKVCGFTTTELPAKNCRSCRKSVDNYVKID